MNKFIYGIIYKSISKIDGKIYIGQTVKHLQKRINEHKNSSKNPKNNIFHKAINEYGFQNFEWEILKECYSKTELDEEEIKYINLFNTKNEEFGFNSKSGGSFGLHSDFTKQIISQGKKGNKNPMFEKIPWNKNKKLSDEHIKNLSKAHKGQKAWNKGLKNKTNIPRTKEVKEKISEANRGENNGMAKLNWNIVKNIREDYKNGYKRKDLIEKYKISAGYLSEILNNKKWRE